MRLVRRSFILGAAALTLAGAYPKTALKRPLVRRLGLGPLIVPGTHPSIGGNINGPSLLRVPEWVERPLGKYYLYFAGHEGRFIRLAFSDRVEGPWKIHSPGVLHIRDTPFPSHLRGSHIASPDVHVDPVGKRFIMYFHGLEAEPNVQVTRAATSPDGLAFAAHRPVLGLSYMRVFSLQGTNYGLAMPGQFYRSGNPLSGFRAGPRLFNANMRHAAVLVRGSRLLISWSQVGDAPERIYLSTIDVSGPWEQWQEAERIELLRPEHAWEGAGLPSEPSQRGIVSRPANQLRDPFLFEEDGRVLLVYGVAGEQGLALAEVFL